MARCSRCRPIQSVEEQSLLLRRLEDGRDVEEPCAKLIAYTLWYARLPTALAVYRMMMVTTDCMLLLERSLWLLLLPSTLALAAASALAPAWPSAFLRRATIEAFLPPFPSRLLYYHPPPTVDGNPQNQLRAVFRPSLTHISHPPLIVTSPLRR